MEQTFLQLLNTYEIEIPIIQRDYAQGRANFANIEDIRKDLLNFIDNKCKKNEPIVFDFIYGTVYQNTLFPLDGQQRLTTLFLLYWYASCRENKLDNDRPILSKFTYTTRESSREFCLFLCGLNQLEPKKCDELIRSIKNENGYFGLWDNDPTIKSMLIMLNDIHRKFRNNDLLYNYLYSLNGCNISFNFLKMDSYGLTDDLYIKMNSRGKLLTNFENFKAKFIQNVKDKGIDTNCKFENSIDGKWTDLLWGYRSENFTIDNAFMNLFTYLTNMIRLEMEPYEKDKYKEFETCDIRAMVDYYDTKGKIELLYGILDLWDSKDKIDDTFNDIFSNKYEDKKVRIFDNDKIIINDIINGKDVRMTNKFVLYYVMRRILYYRNNKKKDTDLIKYARVTRNLALDCRTFRDRTCEFSQDFNYSRQGFSHLKFVMNELLSEDDIYAKMLSKFSNDYDSIDNDRLTKEKRKIEIIKKYPSIENTIFELEDSDLFKSSINNIVDFVEENNNNNNLAKEIINVFTAKFEKIVLALISYGDYSIDIGTSTIGQRHFFGHRKNWYGIITNERNKELNNIIKSFFRDYINISSTTNVDDKLTYLYNRKNKDKYSINDWQYYLLNYPNSIINDKYFTSNTLVMAYKQLNKFTMLYRLNGTTMSSYNSVLIYEIVKNKMPKIVIEDIGYSGIKDKYAVVLSKNNIEVFFDNEMNMSYDSEQKKAIDVKLKDFNNIDLSSLDYVIRLKWMCEFINK